MWLKHQLENLRVSTLLEGLRIIFGGMEESAQQGRWTSDLIGLSDFGSPDLFNRSSSYCFLS